MYYNVSLVAITILNHTISIIIAIIIIISIIIIIMNTYVILARGYCNYYMITDYTFYISC